MDTSRFRAAGAGPPGPRTSSADGPARRCTARPASSHDVGNARVLDRGSAPGSASPVAAYRAAPVTRRAGGCPSAGHNKVGHDHHSRHGAPDATQRWGSSQILSCFVRLVITARRTLSVDERLGSSPWAARGVARELVPARWRGDAGSSPLDGASTATISPRNKLSDAPDSLVDFHTGRDPCTGPRPSGRPHSHRL